MDRRLFEAGGKPDLPPARFVWGKGIPIDPGRNNRTGFPPWQTVGLLDLVIDGSSDGNRGPQIPFPDNGPSAILPNTAWIPTMS